MAGIDVDPAATVLVRGTAELEVDPDVADVQLSVEAQAAARDDAVAEADRVAAAVRTALAGADGVRRSALSRLRVHRDSHWDQATERHVDGDWVAAVAGAAEVEPGAVPAVVGAVLAAGATVGWVGWRLEPANPAHREVRRRAVADAHRAAVDFADALGAALGPLVDLADPGLLAAGGGEPANRHVKAMAAACGGGGGGPEPAVDPEPQTVSASVEARYRLSAPSTSSG